MIHNFIEKWHTTSLKNGILRIYKSKKTSLLNTLLVIKKIDWKRFG